MTSKSSVDARAKNTRRVLLLVGGGIGVGLLVTRATTSVKAEMIFSVLMMATSIAWLVNDGIRHHNPRLAVIGAFFGLVLLFEFTSRSAPDFFGVAALSLIAAAMPTIRRSSVESSAQN